ncbi:hypothetical protein JVU11DRAFT_11448 [Chiua virens]|nr:hypothetical protein JVU11DRAFT_11448 [Chiua virens]
MVAYPLVKIFRRTQQFRHSPIYRVLARDGGAAQFLCPALTDHSFSVFILLYKCPLLDNEHRIPVKSFLQIFVQQLMLALFRSVFVNDPRSQISLAFFLPLSAVVGQRVVLNLRKLRSQSPSESIINASLERRIGVTRRASFTRRDDRLNDSNNQGVSQDIVFRHDTTPSMVEMSDMARL